MKGKKVAAVVLTYNRLALLKECVAAIKSQTTPPDAILVIDNGSEEDTGSWLRSQEGVTLIHLVQNVGPAAGIKKGLQEAYESGYEWIWVMDDDGLPHHQALEKLIRARPGFTGAKNSLVLDKTDRRTLAFKLLQFKTVDDIQSEYVEDEIMPWNGTLFHRSIIEKIGYPKTELFLWGEETEYYHRIKKSGFFKLFTVRDSWHFHPRNAGFFYKGGWDVKTHWRAYFFVRNKYAVYLAKYKQNRIYAGLYYLFFTASMVYFILFHPHKQKIKKIDLTLLAMKDGIRKDYKKSSAEVVEILQKL
ncbi:MAG: putative glycosyltransferase [Flavisolibacter sp.]|nr:putative glycosyltransferase [Flavisolibacter sp.]